MAVTLTSTGIQYYDGTVQTKNTSLQLLGNVSGLATGSTYTFSSIPDHKRLQLVIYNGYPSAGPVTQTIVVTNSSAVNGTVNTKRTYGDLAYSGNGGNDLLYYSTYHQIPSGAVMNIHLVGNNGTVYYYKYHIFSQIGSGLHSGNISLSGKITSMVLNGAATWSDLTASLYYEN